MRYWKTLLVALTLITVGCSQPLLKGAPVVGEAPWEVEAKIGSPIEMTQNLPHYKTFMYAGGIEVTYRWTERGFEDAWDSSVVPKGTFRPKSALWIDWPGKWATEFTVDPTSWEHVRVANSYERLTDHPSDLMRRQGENRQLISEIEDWLEGY